MEQKLSDLVKMKHMLGIAGKQKKEPVDMLLDAMSGLGQGNIGTSPAAGVARAVGGFSRGLARTRQPEQSTSLDEYYKLSQINKNMQEPAGDQAKPGELLPWDLNYTDPLTGNKYSFKKGTPLRVIETIRKGTSMPSGSIVYADDILDRLSGRQPENYDFSNMGAGVGTAGPAGPGMPATQPTPGMVPGPGGGAGQAGAARMKIISLYKSYLARGAQPPVALMEQMKAHGIGPDELQ